MRVLLLMIPISIVLLGIAIWAFVWAVRRGQFDDLDTPALDILVDDDGPRPREVEKPLSLGERGWGAAEDIEIKLQSEQQTSKAFAPAQQARPLPPSAPSPTSGRGEQPAASEKAPLPCMGEGLEERVSAD